MSFDPNVKFEDAEKARDARLSIGKRRHVPQLLGLIDQLKKTTRFYIFNVGPWGQVINTGSTGTYVVPPCPEGEEYVEPKPIEGFYPIPAVRDELIIKNEAEYDRLMDDGWEFTKEVCGVNVRGQSDAHSVRHLGIFPSKNKVPTKEELDAARALLREKCGEHVREIRALYATDRKLFEKVVNPKIHYVAARIMGIDSDPWMLDAAPVAKKKCPYCSKQNDQDAVKCYNCGEIVDPEKYRELKEQETAILEGPKRGRGRPRKTDADEETVD